jgi:hypothetical protein
MKWLSREYLRSVPGQLVLFAGTFAGAVALAVAALCLRGRVFEHYAREKYPPPSAEVQKRIDELTAGAGAARRQKLLNEIVERAALDRLYGVLIEVPEVDPQGDTVRGLVDEHGVDLLRRLRRTLVVGNLSQRRGALRCLGHLQVPGVIDEARELAEWGRARAVRRGEKELVEQADNALQRLSPAERGRPGSSRKGS